MASTDLTAITTSVTNIQNYCQKLTEIFLAGGVANADWATLKAELQSWTNTQLASKANLSTNNTFSGVNYYKPEKIEVRSLYDYYSNEMATTKNPEGIVRFASKDGTYIGGIVNLNFNTYQDMYLRFYGTKEDGTKSHDIYGVLSLSYKKDYDLYYAKCPTLQWATWVSELGIVNVSALRDINAPIVHKSGDEEIDGYKYFKRSISIKWNNTFNYTDISTLPSTINSKQILFYDKNLVATAKIESQLSKSGSSNAICVCDQVNGNNISVAHVTAQYNISNNKAFVWIRGSSFIPEMTNTASLGDSSHLWTEVYASTGSIQTSDKRLKTEIEDIPESVMRAWSKVKFKSFKFKDAAEKKGLDKARIHIGLIANKDAYSIMEAFASEGLDAKKYGLFCHDTWEDVYVEDVVIDQQEKREYQKIIDKPAVYNNGEIIEEEQSHWEDVVMQEEISHIERTLVNPAGEQYSLRYDECLALECAYQRWRLEQLEAKLNK